MRRRLFSIHSDMGLQRESISIRDRHKSSNSIWHHKGPSVSQLMFEPRVAWNNLGLCLIAVQARLSLANLGPRQGQFFLPGRYSAAGRDVPTIDSLIGALVSLLRTSHHHRRVVRALCDRDLEIGPVAPRTGRPCSSGSVSTDRIWVVVGKKPCSGWQRHRARLRNRLASRRIWLLRGRPGNTKCSESQI